MYIYTLINLMSICAPTHIETLLNFNQIPVTLGAVGQYFPNRWRYLVNVASRSVDGTPIFETQGVCIIVWKPMPNTLSTSCNHF